MLGFLNKNWRGMAWFVTFYSISAVLSVLLIWSPFISRKATLFSCHLWQRVNGWLEKYIAGVHWRIEGTENLPPTGCFIFACKHQSAWETLKTHLLFPDPAIVLKKELMAIPLWGRFVRKLGNIPIDRGQGAQALTLMMQAAEQVKAAGRPIIIFPQGTRVLPHQDKPYKNGVIRLYRHLQVPLVPVALNSGKIWPKGALWPQAGTVTINILPAIEAGLPNEIVAPQLRDAIETATAALYTPPAGVNA
ncbi:MAG: lysophospholipid acyltransferase family protein [Alphaproteobacteria bacterium]